MSWTERAPQALCLILYGIIIITVLLVIVIIIIVVVVVVVIILLLLDTLTANVKYDTLTNNILVCLCLHSYAGIY